MKKYFSFYLVGVSLILSCSAEAAGFYLYETSVPKVCADKVRPHKDRPFNASLYGQVIDPQIEEMTYGMGGFKVRGEFCYLFLLAYNGSLDVKGSEKALKFYRDFDGSIKLVIHLDGAIQYAYELNSRCLVKLELEVNGNTCEMSKPRILKTKFVRPGNVLDFMF